MIKTKKNYKKLFFMMLMVLMAVVILPVTASAATKKTIAVTVSNAEITDNKLSLTATGMNTITVKYNGRKITATKATYKSSKTAVATVSKKGVITAKKAGKTVITVKYKGISKKLTLTVTKPAVTVQAGSVMVASNKFTTSVGVKTQMLLILEYKNSGSKTITSKVISPTRMKWTSSNTRIATVSENGVITAKKAGKAVIKMTYGSVSKSVTVTVAKKHTHKWAAVTTKEWVVDTDGWTESVKVDWYYLCSCGINFGHDNDAWVAHWLEKAEENAQHEFNPEDNQHSYSYIDVMEAVYHEPTGHYEMVITGYKCSCGAMK